MEKTSDDETSNDKTLQDFIESKSYTEAIEFLRGKPTFSEDGLDQSLISACRHGHKYLIQELVRQGANVQYKDIHGNTALLICAGNGFIDSVRYLLTHKASVNDVNSAGDTALILSVCSSGSTDLTKLLLKQDGIDINQQNREGSTALMKAIEALDIDTIKLLLDKSQKIEQKSYFDFRHDYKSTTLDPTLNWNGETVHKLANNHRLKNIFKLFKTSIDSRTSPLVLAVKECDKKSVCTFLDCEFLFMKDMKQSIDESFREIFRHLKMSTACDDRIEIIKKLLECGRDNKECQPFTPLINIITERRRETSSVFKFVRLLLECGASVKERGSEDSTPLMMAAEKEGSVAMLKKLLDYGADFNSFDRNGSTALMYAVRKGCTQNVLFLLKFAKKKELSLDAQNHQGSTALMLAVNGNDAQLVKMLLAQGADVNIRDQLGNTALLMAIQSYPEFRKKNVETLIRARSDVNGQNCDGLSPLMMAARKGLTDVITILLDSGADVNAVSNQDKSTTAMGVLLKNFDLKMNMMSCLRVLLERGASSSTQNQEALHKIIIEGEVDVIPKLIQCGLGPADVKTSLLEYRKLKLDYSDCHVIPTVSPLCVALLVGNAPLARYFLGNLFLTKSDVSSLMFKRNFQLLSKLTRFQECLNLLDETSSQPLSLFQLAFVTVTSAVDTLPRRDDRIYKLPLPQVMKDMLLFKSQEVQLDISAAKFRPLPPPPTTPLFQISYFELSSLLIRQAYSNRHFWDDSDDDYYDYTSD